jgi:hypothetical protein
MHYSRARTEIHLRKGLITGSEFLNLSAPQVNTTIQETKLHIHNNDEVTEREKKHSFHGYLRGQLPKIASDHCIVSNPTTSHATILLRLRYL